MPAVTILTETQTAVASGARPEGSALWLRNDELEATTGWEIKPEGICRGEVCVPLPADRAAELLREQDGESWLDVAGFARFVGQDAAHDADTGTWYFGPGPGDRAPRFDMLQAPDFELPDLQGRMHRLSDHRGKKVLLALWASW